MLTFMLDGVRYCYILNDLSEEKLAKNCSDYESLRDYLRISGREAYLQKRVKLILSVVY